MFRFRPEESGQNQLLPQRGDKKQMKLSAKDSKIESESSGAPSRICGLFVYCCPFRLTSTETSLGIADGGVLHSTSVFHSSSPLSSGSEVAFVARRSWITGEAGVL